MHRIAVALDVDATFSDLIIIYPTAFQEPAERGVRGRLSFEHVLGLPWSFW